MIHTPYAIFDMDGTLVDSMPCWYSLHGAYTREVCPDMEPWKVALIEKAWGFPQIFAAFDRFAVPYTKADYYHFIESRMGHFYAEVICPKPKTLALLEEMKEAGVKMGIITMTPHSGADLCLHVTGLAPYFSFVLTREDTLDASGKEKEDIFKIALAKLGCDDPNKCTFYEDSVYALKTARKMGFYIRAVEDRWDDDTRKEANALADEVLSLGYNLPQ